MFNDKDLQNFCDSLICSCVIHDQDGRIVYINEAAELFFSISKTDILENKKNLTDWELYDSLERKLDITEYPAYIALSEKSYYPPTIIGLLPPNKTEMSWCEVTAKLLVNTKTSNEYVIVTFTDQTHLVRKNHELMMNNKNLLSREKQLLELAKVVETTDNIVVITDSNEKITWVNEGFIRLTEYKLDEVIGKKPSEILQGDRTSLETKREIRKAIDNRESITCEILNYSKSGREYWLNMNIQPILNESGDLLSFVAIEMDLTERKHAEDKLNALNNKLVNTLSQRDQLYSILVHDMRSPFNGINGLCDILLDESNVIDDEERREYLTKMRQVSVQTLEMIDRTINWASNNLKIEEQRIPENFPITNTIENAISIYEIPLKNKKINLEYNYKFKDNFNTYHVVLATIIRNLINNAIKFSKEGSTVKLVTEGSKSKLSLQVIDEGIGMDPSLIQKILNKEKVSSQAGTLNEKGSGFGLLTIIDLIEQLDGEVNIESQVGVGTCFTITIPGLPSS